MGLSKRNFGSIVLLTVALFQGGETPVSEVSQGSRELPQARGRVSAREALALVSPTIKEASKKPVLILITSGSDIDAEGRSGRWEFVFHFPSRFAQAVYSLESSNPELGDAGLRVRWRLSPRRDVTGEDAGLPFDFTDSPEAAHQLSPYGCRLDRRRPRHDSCHQTTVVWRGGLGSRVLWEGVRNSLRDAGPLRVGSERSELRTAVAANDRRRHLLGEQDSIGTARR